MRVLMLGGTEFTGPYTVRRLVEIGHEVYVFHRGKSNAPLPSSVRRIIGDYARLPDYAEEFRRIAPDVVVDMICYTEAAAQTTLQTLRGLTQRVVTISSEDVYRAYGRLHRTEPGPPDPIPLTEESPLRERLSIHGEAYDKIAVERVMGSAPELPCTILRFPAVYGPRDTLHRFYPYLKRMDDGRPVILLEAEWADWRWSRGYVENVAQATLLAVTEKRAAGRIYNVAEPDAPTEAEWIERIAAITGWKGEIVRVSRETLATPDEALPLQLKKTNDLSQHWVVDTSRIREELGYSEETPRDEALRRTIAWERANPPEQSEPEWFDYAAEDAILAALA